MNREIKFRAWKKSEQRYVTWREFIANPADLGDAILGYKYASVEQYIGIKDKNGKEIYVGDIVNYTWSDDHWTSGFDRVKVITISLPHAGFLVESDKLEVIGNIHTEESL